MSLVSSLIGNITWDERATNAEYKVYLIDEEIFAMTQQIGDMKENTNNAIQDINAYKNHVNMLSLALSNPNLDEEKRANLSERIAQYNEDILRAERNKCIVDNQIETMHEKEVALQKELKLISAEVQLAKAQGESFQKMQEGAIKRLTINV